jgi:hypothetical protein
MKFHEFGSKKNPHIMLIHGGETHGGIICVRRGRYRIVIM